MRLRHCKCPLVYFHFRISHTWFYSDVTRLNFRGCGASDETVKWSCIVRIEWGLRRRREPQSMSRLSLVICFGRPRRLMAGLVIRPPYSNVSDYLISLLKADEPEHSFQDFTLVIFSYINFHDPSKFLPAHLRKVKYKPSKLGELEITKLVCNLFAHSLTLTPTNYTRWVTQFIQPFTWETFRSVTGLDILSL
jgi:hypothetical protein